MKKKCRNRRRLGVAFLCSVALCAAGCAAHRAPKPAEWSPLESARAPHDPLPDDAERSAARLAAAVLADRRGDARAEAASIDREDAAREARGEKPSGLADNAAELLAACDGSDAFAEDADDLLDRDDLDPALRRRVEHARDSAPLAVADTRLAEETRYKLGAIFNRIIEPASTLAMTGALNPITAARGAISTLLTAWTFPSASPREREALHEYDEWLARHPEAPGEREIRARADELRAKLARERATRDMRGAQAAADRRDWEVVDILASRALRQLPDDADAKALLAKAHEESAKESARDRASLGVRALAPASLAPEQEARWLALARAAANAPLAQVAGQARAFADAGAPPELAPTLRLLESYEPLARGDEDETARALARVPEHHGAPDTASRQAGAALADPSRNAYAHFRAAESADDTARWKWLALGHFANGFPHGTIWRPLELVLDVPGVATTLATIPFRIVQYPAARPQFGGGVIVAGERYAARHPDGAHREEVHAELEELYAQRNEYAAALRHAEARAEPNAKEIAQYRAKLADQLVAAAEKQRRTDVRLAYLAMVLRDLPDTPAADKARKKFIAERADASPQRIRMTHDFLVEHPALWGPGALGIAPELLDGKRANGEIAEDGVTLLGKNVIRLELEGHEPVTTRVPPDDFAHFVALLEETSRSHLARDAREKADPDAARDAFFDDTKLGMLDSADPRGSARSDAVYESTHEKYGFVHSRDPILPVDIVLQGDLESLGLSAFPRIRLPEPAPDALLYE
ncbi:MAG TPA: hypothetical protein VMR31_09240 [Myxococcota bacterium]|nr:hypothetical protein [Myxococcota bacterium]